MLSWMSASLQKTQGWEDRKTGAKREEKGTCLYLLHDALLVVVAQRAAQLVVVHGGPVFLNAPATSHLTHTIGTQTHTHVRIGCWQVEGQTWRQEAGTDLLRLDEFELHAATGPGDEVSVGRVVQQGDEELPELQGATALVGRAVAVSRRLLLYFPCKRRKERRRGDGEEEAEGRRRKEASVNQKCSASQFGETFLPDGQQNALAGHYAQSRSSLANKLQPLPSDGLETNAKKNIILRWREIKHGSHHFHYTSNTDVQINSL